MNHLKQKIQELGKEIIDHEYQNTPVKVFCEKYQVCYETCISIMGKKIRGSYKKRGESYVRPSNERTLNTERWVIPEHKYKIIGEYRETGWIKGVQLVKNSGYTVQH